MSKDIEKLVENLFAKEENIFSVEQIKDLIFEQLLESKYGIIKYKKGSEFVSTTDPDEKYSLVSMVVFPAGGGSYPDKKQTEEELKKYFKNNKIEAKAESGRLSKSALLAVFADKNKKFIGYVKYANSMNADGMGKWSESDFARDTNLQPYQAGTSAKAESLPIKPVNLIGDDNRRKVDALVSHATAKADQLLKAKKIPQAVYEHIKQLLNAASNNLSDDESNKLAGGAQYLSSYNLYLSEILAPISVLTGWKSSGNRTESEEALLNGKKYGTNMLTYFNSNSNDGLYDSAVQYTDSLKVLISSKGGKKGEGAPAAVRGLYETMDKLKTRDEAKYNSIVKEHKQAYEILNIIINKKQFLSPVYVARKINLIDDQQLINIENIINKRQNATIEEVMSYISQRKNSNLLTYWNNFNAKKTVPYIRLISCLASAVAESVNSKNEFDLFARNVLENGLIQVNSIMVETSDGGSMFKDFKIVYPPVISGKIKLISGKTYQGDAISGNFTFKIPTN